MFIDKNLLFFAIALVVTIAALFSWLIPMDKNYVNHTLEIYSLALEDAGSKI